MTFSEEQNCLSGTPVINDNSCPPVAPVPVVRNSPISLNISGTQYSGFLQTDWLDRINRINVLQTTLVRLILAFQDGLNWRRTKIFQFRNPYNADRGSATVTVNQRGFPLLLTYLDVINDKLDNLHDDLPRIEAVASIVEHWQIKKEANRPFCAFLFGETFPEEGRIGSGKWQISVPHADFAAMDDFTNEFGYRKGPIQYLYTMSDNSKIMFYCRFTSEGDALLERLLQYVPTEFKEGAYLKVGEYKGPPFKNIYVRLRRIDWYEQGLLRNKPTFYRTFPNTLTVG
jgi:hypothetical protein